MERIKIFDLCILLDKEEFLNFEQYLIHFMKAKKQCLQLYVLIKECYQKANYNWRKTQLDLHQLAEKIYPKKVGKHTFAKLRYELLKYLEEYCAFLQFKKDKQYHLIHFLAERGNQNYFKKVLNKANREFEGKESITLEKTKYELWNGFMQIEFVSNKEKYETDFKGMFDSFTNYSLLRRMQLYCILLNRYWIIIEKAEEIEEEIKLEMQEITKLVLKRKGIELIAQVYVTCIQMLEGDFKKATELRELLTNKKEKLAIEEQKKMFNYLYTICLQKIRKFPENKSEYRKEIIKDYFYRYENNLLQEGGFIPIQHIKNLCNYATTRMNRTDELRFTEKEAEEIIKEVTKKASPEYRSSTRNHVYGVFHFFNKDFKKAIEVLSRQKKGTYSNYALRFDDYTVLLRSTYEIEEPVDSRVTGFIKILNRNRTKSIPNLKWLEYYNFAKAIKKLDALKNLSRTYRSDKEKALKEMKNILKKPIKLSNWFEQKLEELGFEL